VRQKLKRYLNRPHWKIKIERGKKILIIKMCQTYLSGRDLEFVVVSHPIF